MNTTNSLIFNDFLNSFEYKAIIFLLKNLHNFVLWKYEGYAPNSSIPRPIVIIQSDEVVFFTFYLDYFLKRKIVL
jgi:hypothetical protein